VIRLQRNEDVTARILVETHQFGRRLRSSANRFEPRQDINPISSRCVSSTIIGSAASKPHDQKSNFAQC
jgi:hypothetical protein